MSDQRVCSDQVRALRPHVAKNWFVCDNRDEKLRYNFESRFNEITNEHLRSSWTQVGRMASILITYWHTVKARSDFLYNYEIQPFAEFKPFDRETPYHTFFTFKDNRPANRTGRAAPGSVQRYLSVLVQKFFLDSRKGGSHLLDAIFSTIVLLQSNFHSMMSAWEPLFLLGLDTFGKAEITFDLPKFTKTYAVNSHRLLHF